MNPLADAYLQRDAWVGELRAKLAEREPYRVDGATPYHGSSLVDVISTRIEPAEEWVNFSRYCWVIFKTILILVGGTTMLTGEEIEKNAENEIKIPRHRHFI